MSSSEVKRLQKALEFQRAGRLDEAKKIYQGVLASNPKCHHALHFLGLIHFQLGERDKGIRLVEKAAALCADAAVYLTLGGLQEQCENYKEAIRSFEQAISLSKNPKAVFQLARCYQKLGEFEKSLGLLTELLLLDNLNADYHFWVGRVHMDSNSLDQAVSSFESVLRLNADHILALNNLSIVYIRLGENKKALSLLKRAEQLKPYDPKILNNIGTAYRKLGLVCEALGYLQKAITLKPDYAEAFFNIGNAYGEKYDFEKAVEAFLHAIKLKPTYSEALYNLGNAYRDLGLFQNAFEAYHRAIALKPSNFDVQMNLSLLHLLLGDYERGWRLYEARWETSSLSGGRGRVNAPLWLGDFSIRGKTILLSGEQGLGDTLQFSRYAKKVKALGAGRVLLGVQPSLASLLKGLEGVDELVMEGQRVEGVQCYCPLMSLPLAFKTTVETIPASPRYLEAPRAKVEHWAHRLGVKTRPRVGLVWSGSVGHKHDRSRSIPFEVFRELLAVEDIEWVSLQKEVRASDREVFEASAVFDVSKELTDFSDTAALCELMDLVICVDTSVAHLSAALGRPTWIMVAKTPDFRWLLEREDSPWYPTLRLFRQTTHGAWDDVFTLIKEEIRTAFDYLKEEGSSAQIWTAHYQDQRYPRRDSIILFNRGVNWQKSNNHKAALCNFERALEIDPNYEKALVNRGICLHALGQIEEAIISLKRTTEINPSNHFAWYNLGRVYQDQELYELALDCFDRVIQLFPSFSGAYHARGLVQKKLGFLDEAIKSYIQAHTINPQDERPLKNLGNIYKRLGNFEVAEKYFRLALSASPDDAQIALHLSLVLLAQGQFKEGWALYERRLGTDEFITTQPIPGIKPLTSTRQVLGSSILMLSEQGLGDTIQFVRYVSLLKKAGAREFVLVAPACLHSLLRRLDGLSSVTEQVSAPIQFDYQIHLMSLPYLFGTTMTTIPFKKRYLEANAESIGYWKARLSETKKPSVGVVWSGSEKHTADKERSIPFEVFRELLAVEDIEWVSLQKEVRASDREFFEASGVLDVSKELTDFSDTAALCNCLDLIISVDTSVAHLAAALGRPTWVLLPKVPDFRWLTDRDDSPWYPSIKLYRQDHVGDWACVIEKVQNDLEFFVNPPVS